MAAAEVQRQPDIQYHPDYNNYLKRSTRRQQTENLSSVLPQELPQQLSSSFVWDGNDIQGRNDWIVALEDHDLAEIDEALKYFKGNVIMQASCSI